jgi:serine/threonine protein kinase
LNVIDRWDEVEALFHAALESPPEQREAVLTSACSDPDLLAAVRNLLMEDAKSGGVLGSSSSGFTRLLDELAPDLGEGPLLGSTIGPYKILEVLGHGGMGEVYLAEDTRLGRKVALKFLSTSVLGRGDTLRRFVMEARATSALNHPNIVTIHDVGQAESVSYIAVEYIEGQTLRRRMEKPLTPAEAVDISVQVARALAAAHKSGVIHRDIKPENIMLRSDGLVKVVDFGLAKVQRSELFRAGLSSNTFEAPGTVPGAIMGTVFYMSPEQATGQEADARTDLFSLGVVMYEMLAGRKPFRGDTLPAFLESLMRDDAEPISLPDDRANAQIEAILARALSKSREQRYQTADELLGDLEQALYEIHAGAEGGILSQRSGAMQSRSFWRSDWSVKSTAIMPSPLPPPGRLPLSKRAFRLMVTVASLIALTAAAVLVNVMLRKTPIPGALQNGIVIQRLTNSGDVQVAAISGDKQFLAYATQNENGASMWIRETSTGVERRILGPGRADFRDLMFSPDGTQVYYVAELGYSPGALFRIAVAAGSSPVKIKDNIQGVLSFSPDGKQLAHVSNGARSLSIASEDGPVERTLATLSENEVWRDPAWSPDGKTIASSVSVNHAESEYLAAVAIDSGAVSRIGPDRWIRVAREAWLRDGSGLIISAADRNSQILQLWYVSYPQGVARRITNDTIDYEGITLSDDGESIVAVQSRTSTDIWAMNAREQNTARRIPSSSRNSPTVHVAWTGDGKIV